MAISYPYSVAFLNDRLPIEDIVWTIQRNDELSGAGDARVWQAELGDPLWSAEVRLGAQYHNDAKQAAALIRKLHGAENSFFLCDPTSLYPQSDISGATLGAAAVQINSIGVSRNSLSLKGLPAGYTLTLGDKLQITFASPAQAYFGEFDETVSANGAGVTGLIEVFPHLPAGVAVSDTVTLAKPACKGFIMPGSHNPGTSRGFVTEGGSFTFMERRR